MLKGVLLDVDGTLIDSNDAHAEAFVRAAEMHNRHLTLDQVRRRIGMGGDLLLSQVLGVTQESPLVKKISESKKEIFKKHYLTSLKAFPKTRELLQRFKADGLKLIVATSASGTELKALLNQTGLQDLIDGQTNADDIEDSKPAPDVVHSALATGNLKPQEAIMLGDTPYDLDAAQRAGVSSVALLCGGWDNSSLRKARQIYNNPADLLNSYEQSIFRAHSLLDGLAPL